MAWTINGEATTEAPRGSLTRRRTPIGEAWTWEMIIDGDFDVADEIEIPGIATPCGLYLLEADLLVADGAATTLQPEVGLENGWTVDRRGHVAKATAAAVAHRIAANEGGDIIAIPAISDTSLYIRLVPDAQLGASGQTWLRVTLTQGG